MSTMKHLQVTVDSEILNTLKTNNYVLCIAKMVNNAYTVIWEGKKSVLANNTFAWEPKYELFATLNFQSGIQVGAETDPQPIQGGLTCLLNSAGILGTPTGSIDASSPFYMDNQYALVHPGVNVIMPDNSSVPIYVAEHGVIIGMAELLPKEKVVVWFEQRVETSMMISKVQGISIELDFTTISSQSVRYTNDMKFVATSVGPNQLFYFKGPKLEDAFPVRGLLDYLVKFQPLIRDAVRGSLIIYVMERLINEGYRPETVDFHPNGTFHISFPKQNALQYILGGYVPDYEEAIDGALKGALRDVKGIPNCETWNIFPKKVIRGEKQMLKHLMEELNNVHQHEKLVSLLEKAEIEKCM